MRYAVNSDSSVHRETWELHQIEHLPWGEPHIQHSQKVGKPSGFGLIEMEPVGDGRTTRVLLTDMGVRVVNLLRDIESIMSEQ